MTKNFLFVFAVDIGEDSPDREKIKFKIYLDILIHHKEVRNLAFSYILTVHILYTVTGIYVHSPNLEKCISVTFKRTKCHLL
jgi:hypothetical protein